MLVKPFQTVRGRMAVRIAVSRRHDADRGVNSIEPVLVGAVRTAMIAPDAASCLVTGDGRAIGKRCG